MTWQLAEAKNKFSEVVRLALQGQLQRVTRRNESVVIMSEEHYQRLMGAKPTFTEYLSSAPSLERLDIQRDKTTMRDVTL